MELPDGAAAARLCAGWSRARLSRARVLVIGDVMLDRYWFGDVRRISPEAPVPIVQIAHSEDRLGGAANVARNVVALGGQASLLGSIGDDDAGRCVRHALALAGVQDCTRSDPQRPTVVKLRVLGRQQQLLRIDFDGSCTPLPALADGDVLHSLIAAHDVIVLSDYAKGGCGNPVPLVAAARALGRPILVDPKGDDFSVYTGANLLTPNLAELRQIVGAWRSEQELAQKAQALRQSLALDALLLTRSAEGMSLFDASGARHFPAQAREVFDVSGAGDTAIAVLALMMASGAALGVAIDYANRAAGLAVAKLGTATVSHEELFVDGSA